MTKIELPNDIDALKDLVIEKHELLAQKHELFTQEHQRAELFKHRYEVLARRYFGRSSEKRQEAPGQQMLFDLPSEPERPAPAEEAEEESAPRKKKRRRGRKPIPAELPRQRIEYTVPEEERICPCCGDPMQPFGEEVTEQREFIPASLFVIQHVRFKYACKKGCAEKPVLAAGPQKVTDRISAGPGLLAWNVVAKFQHHQPMYRQEDIFKQHGDRISRSTQCRWQATVADLLEPIYLRMSTHVVQSRKIHTDDTPVRVLEPGTGKTRTARFWVYLGDNDHPFTVFDYTPNRKRDGPERFLKDYRGYLQADAYTGYDRLYAGQEVIEVACWAHCRRKYFDARDTDTRADEMLALIGELYAVEEEGRVWSAPERKLLRQMKSRPVLDRIRAWLDEHGGKVLPKSPLGQAITYTKNQWTALTRYLEDGDLEADNNLGENALRPICLGRNYAESLIMRI